MSRARQGKIARLPHALREEVNRRLADGQPGSVLLGWLNVHADALRVWGELELELATAQNLSEWRQGGYKDWCQQRQKVEDLKSLSAHAHELAKAGGGVEDGLAAVLGGHILASWEELLYSGGGDGTAADGEDAVDAKTDVTGNLSKLVQAATRLKKAAHDEQKLELAQRAQKHKEKQLDLEREKFELTATEKLLDHARSPAVQAILDSGTPRGEQMARLREFLFGG